MTTAEKDLALVRRVAELEAALDLATQGKYSQLMLDMAQGAAKIASAGLQAGVLRGEFSVANQKIAELEAQHEQDCATMAKQALRISELNDIATAYIKAVGPMEIEVKNG